MSQTPHYVLAFSNTVTLNIKKDIYSTQSTHFPKLCHRCLFHFFQILPSISFYSFPLPAVSLTSIMLSYWSPAPSWCPHLYVHTFECLIFFLAIGNHVDCFPFVYFTNSSTLILCTFLSYYVSVKISSSLYTFRIIYV
jgi:hypothetical protein